MELVNLNDVHHVNDKIPSPNHFSHTKGKKSLVSGLLSEEVVQDRTLYLYVTFFGDICYENLKFCGCHTTQEPRHMADFSTIHYKLCICEWPILQDMCISGGQ